MDYNEQEVERLKGLFRKYNYYPVDSSFDLDSLAQLDLYRKITLNGKVSYVLFHKKGSPIPKKAPGSLYIAKEDMDAFLIIARNQSPAPAKQTPTLSSIAEEYEKQVLDNDSLSPEQKIHLTLHSANELMNNIFGSSILNLDQVEQIKKMGEKLDQFIRRVVRDDKSESHLLDLLIGHDYYTYSHCIHVSMYAGILAGKLIERGLPFSDETVRALCVGALMHDIGKIRIDRRIINKDGKLTAEEFDEIKKHPRFGAEIAREAKQEPEVVSVIEQHHECWAGGGYPLNLKGEKILPISRIACICDVFDALTTNRSYRQAMRPFDALTLMSWKMQNSFFPNYLQIFIKFLGRQSR